MTQHTGEHIRESVRSHYKTIATQKVDSGCGCCGEGSHSAEYLSSLMGYSADELKNAPVGANMALGCGNPQAIASLTDGEIVLDLGSGSGFDCFLAAGKVGDKGHVIGVDMTPEMISKARTNTDKGGYRNVEFRLGEIENIPVADNFVDVVMSNCVINLSIDKRRVFGDTFRVLKPGGRLAIADVVATADVPESIRHDMKKWSGCAAGALQVKELKQILSDVGFENISIEPVESSKNLIKEWSADGIIDDFFVSAHIMATKP